MHVFLSRGALGADSQSLSLSVPLERVQVKDTAGGHRTRSEAVTGRRSGEVTGRGQGRSKGEVSGGHRERSVAVTGSGQWRSQGPVREVRGRGQGRSHVSGGHREWSVEAIGRRQWRSQRAVRGGHRDCGQGRSQGRSAVGGHGYKLRCKDRGRLCQWPWVVSSQCSVVRGRRSARRYGCQKSPSQARAS